MPGARSAPLHSVSLALRAQPSRRTLKPVPALLCKMAQTHCELGSA